MKRLSREKRFNGHGAAVNLAFFHGEVDGAAALVAGDNGELSADRVFKEPWQVETGAGRLRRSRIWGARTLYERLR